MRDAYDSRLEAPRTDMAQQVFSVYEKNGEKVDYGWGDVEQESYGALFAGSDTTAIAFRTLFYYLMHNPDIYSRLEKEIDEAMSEGRLSMPPTFKQANQLPYLCACIKEALRIHPGAQLCKWQQLRNERAKGFILTLELPSSPSNCSSRGTRSLWPIHSRRLRRWYQCRGYAFRQEGFWQ